MQKFIKLFYFLAILGFISISVSSIISISKAANEKYNITGNNQYYSVVYDNEGEAAVVAKLDYTNSTTEEIKDFNLDIPGNSVRIISVVQEVETTQTNKQCKRYNYNYQFNDQCLEWEEVPISSYNYALLESKGNQEAKTYKANITLAKGIGSQQNGTIILNYKTKGMATRVWNGFNYAFETIKSPYDIDNVNVAIDVTDDLYIKDKATGQTNYQQDFPQAQSTLKLNALSASPIMERISTSIPTAPGVTKQTSSLDPNESFKVEGKYYSSELLSNLPTFTAVGITFLIIFILIIIIIKNEKKRV